MLIERSSSPPPAKNQSRIGKAKASEAKPTRSQK
jgi:hypothetical protein